MVFHKHMKLTVDNLAAEWFKDEVGMRPDWGIRIKTKIYSSSPIDPGIGIGIESAESDSPIAFFRADNGISFFIEEQDAWYFKEYDLHIVYDKTRNEPAYQFLKDGKIFE